MQPNHITLLVHPRTLHAAMVSLRNAREVLLLMIRDGDEACLTLDDLLDLLNEAIDTLQPGSNLNRD